jgi:hypothetical protein
LKLPLSILLIVIIIIGLTSVSGHDLVAQASPEFSGTITSNTVWTKADSPHTLTGNAFVEKETTLTVEAGSIVNLNSFNICVNGTFIIQEGVTVNMGTKDAAIQVNGVLNAKGTSSAPIFVNGAVGYSASVAPASYSSIRFSPSSAGWNEEAGTGCIIENTRLNSTSVIAENSLKLSNSTISGSELSFSGGSPIIISNTISAVISFEEASPIIANNNISGGFISLGSNNAGSAVVTDNTISDAKTSQLGSTAGIAVGYWKHMYIQRNLVTNCFAGIQIATDNPVAKTSSIVGNNTFTNNLIGIWVLNRYTPAITYNNIYNNDFNVRLGDISNNLTDTEIAQYATNDIDLSNNYWGTNDQEAINRSIYDSKNDFELGKINFVPYLIVQNPEALPNAALSVSLIHPSPTPEISDPFLTSSSTIIVVIIIVVTPLILSIILVRKRKFSKLKHTKSS